MGKCEILSDFDKGRIVVAKYNLVCLSSSKNEEWIKWTGSWPAKYHCST